MMKGTAAGVVDSLIGEPTSRAETYSVCFPWRKSDWFWMATVVSVDQALRVPLSTQYAYSTGLPEGSSVPNVTFNVGSFVGSYVSSAIASG